MLLNYYEIKNMYISSATNPAIHPQKKTNTPSFKSSQGEIGNNHNQNSSFPSYPKEYYLSFKGYPPESMMRVFKRTEQGLQETKEGPLVSVIIDQEKAEIHEAEAENLRLAEADTRKRKAEAKNLEQEMETRKRNKRTVAPSPESQGVAGSSQIGQEIQSIRSFNKSQIKEKLHKTGEEFVDLIFQDGTIKVLRFNETNSIKDDDSFLEYVNPRTGKPIYLSSRNKNISSDQKKTLDSLTSPFPRSRLDVIKQGISLDKEICLIKEKGLVISAPIGEIHDFVKPEGFLFLHGYTVEKKPMYSVYSDNGPTQAQRWRAQNLRIRSDGLPLPEPTTLIMNQKGEFARFPNQAIKGITSELLKNDKMLVPKINPINNEFMFYIDEKKESSRMIK